MDDTQFYFINDSYFEDFPDLGLMENKEADNKSLHGRPFFLAVRDKREPRIMWMVPISSKIKKYQAIRKEKMRIYGLCNTVIFGKLREKDTTFLIQNICPVTDKYLTPYLDNKGNPIMIDESLSKRIRKLSKKLLILSRQGVDVIFPDVARIYWILLKRIKRQDRKEARESRQES